MIDPSQVHSAAQYAELVQQERQRQENTFGRRALVGQSMPAPLRSPAEKPTESPSDSNGQRLRKGAKVNTAFDTYTLVKQVGQGGNGTVFSALSSDQTMVAVKFVERNCGKEKLKRFKNEVHFCETHKHKNIVPILDRGYAFLNQTEYVFYVMPLYEQTLKDKIQHGIEPDEAVSVFTGILEGLKYAHQHETIHRDIKPENILFAKDSTEPVLCDFGIAHFAQEELLTAIETKKGSRMANFQYCAPEQRAKAGQILPQTDLYAAAMILNEMFTKEIPLGSDYPKIASVNSDYAYLDTVVSELLRQHPEDRLYPEDQIISEMKLRAEQQKRAAQVEKLKKVQAQMIEPEQFEANIIRKAYADGYIEFTFDRDLPDTWYWMIKNESFSHTTVMGYEKNRLTRIRKDTLGLPIRGDESKESIRSIIEHVDEWVKTINALYQLNQFQAAQREAAAREERRKEDIQQLENENRISNILSQL